MRQRQLQAPSGIVGARNDSHTGWRDLSRSKRPRKKQPAQPMRAGAGSGVVRRAFLLGGASVAAIAAGWLVLRPGSRGSEAPVDSGTPQHSPVSFLPAGSVPLLLGLADLVVPAWKGQPAASDIDLLPRLERVVGSSRSRADFYRRKWVFLERDLRRAVPYEGGLPLAADALPLLQSWYEEYRSVEVPSAAAHMFEVLRRDLLRAYYASPAGWKAVGYAGPARRSHPRQSGDP
jgi:hypothetical protein